MQFLTLLGLAGAAIAFPQVDPSSALCSRVSHRPGGCTAPGQPSAKAYCSSFLSIGTRTVTTTVQGTITSTATATVAGGTVTVTSPTTSFAFNTTTITLSTPSTTVFTTTVATSTTTANGGVIAACAAPSAAAKLMKRAVPKPVCLRRFGSGAELTSACQCFPISTAASTITSTGASTTVTSTSTVGASVTVTTTPVITTTLVLTSTITSGLLVSTTTSVTATTTVTNGATTGTVIPTDFVIVAQGGGITGEFADAGDDDEQITVFGPAADANSFFLNSTTSNLIEANGTIGLVANEGPTGSAPAVFWDSAATIRQFPDILIPITCSVVQNADNTCPLTCTGPFGNNNNYCNGVWYLSTDDLAPCTNNFNTFVVTPAAA